MSYSKSITDKLKRLRSDTSNPWPEKTFGRAPHKPLLLLVVFDGIHSGKIPTNKIELTQDLVESFFFYWDALMGEQSKTTVALPYFHLNSDGFWRLVYFPDQSPFTYSPSIGAIRARISHAELDEDLFEFVKSDVGYLEATQFIKYTYFDTVGASQITELQEFSSYADKYIQEIEKFSIDQFVVDHTGDKIVKNQTYKRKVRDLAFSKEVRNLYDFSCAMCGSKIITEDGRTLVDAAHILERSTYQNDDKRNGISLCKTHHWMFDHKQVSITPDYEIVFSKWLDNSQNNPKWTNKIENKEIKLPDDSRFHPAKEALEIHYENFRS